ncbi:MAG: hypothetical protein QGI93_11780 [Planctomycetota bacterium]|nr:hypothetical protein [Planctomycetota bacterium]
MLILPLALRLAPIEHGMPRNHVADTHIVKNALGMARDLDPVPPMGRYSTYPYLLSYALLPIYAVEYGAGRILGEWSGKGEFAERLFAEPDLAHRPARYLCLLLACLAPLALFGAARSAGLKSGAWIAAYLVGTGLLHLQFSIQERPWAPLVSFMALAGWGATAYVNSGRRVHLLASAVAAGLAFATHQAGAAALGITGLAWLTCARHANPDGKAAVGLGFKAVALFAVTALVLGHPYYVMYGGVDKSAVAASEALGSNSISIGGQALVFAFRAETWHKLSRALVGYDPVLVVLALGGLVWGLRTRAARPITGMALLWAAFFMTNQGDHTRYLLPLSVLLALPAAAAGQWLWERRPARPLLLVLLALPLVQATRLVWVMRQEDTRAEAERALLALGPDGPIAVDCYGPEVPMNAQALTRLAQHRELGGREARRVMYFEADAVPPAGEGIDVLPLESVLDYDLRTRSSWVEEEEVERLGTDPNALLRELGMRYVLVVDRTPDNGVAPILLDAAPATLDSGGQPRPKLKPVVVRGKPLFTIHPAGKAGSVADANLPAELSFPLTQIWDLKRPGPKLELFRLPEERP